MRFPCRLSLCIRKETCCPQLCVPKPKFNEKEEVTPIDMFEILAHQVPICEPRKKKKSKSPEIPLTTYNNDFCQRKIPPAENLPQSTYPGYFIPGLEFSSGTTQKRDFKQISEKELFECRGKIDYIKCNLTCPKVKFDGQSETKSVFKLGPRQKFCAETTIPPPIHIKGRKTKLPFDGKTVSSSTYKPHADYTKLKPYINESGFQKVKEPFKALSQYQEDYRNRSKQKRQLPCIPVEFHLTEIPVMENETTYKTSFQYKRSFEKKPTKWNPNHPIYKSTTLQGNNPHAGKNYCCCCIPYPVNAYLFCGDQDSY